MNQIDSRPLRILVTDDEKDVRQFLALLVRMAGFEALEAADGKAALQLVRNSPPNAVLLDMHLPGMNGLAVLKELHQLRSELPVILLTGHGSVGSAVEAMRAGAFDYLTKPFNNDALLEVLRRAVESYFKVPAAGEGGLEELMGPGEKIRQLSAAVHLVAPTDFTVIVAGETGAGKELVAQAIHRFSHRAEGPFVPLDCGSIPPTLIESELFGHEKGSFTGADRSRPGKFEEAAGGTLFLDEIQNLSSQVQAKLLRALQERQVYRVGSTRAVAFDVRIVAATNEDVSGLVETGRFRRDLYHRLNEFGIRVPPLRERAEDLLYLAERFLRQTSAELGKDVREISPAAQELLFDHSWPGNVRELRNVIRRSVLLAGGAVHPEHLLMDGTVAASDFAPSRRELHVDGKVSFKELVRRSLVEWEREILVHVLKQTGGNQAKAARLLQVDYKTIRTKTKQYGIRFKGGTIHGEE